MQAAPILSQNHNFALMTLSHGQTVAVLARTNSAIFCRFQGRRRNTQRSEKVSTKIFNTCSMLSKFRVLEVENV